MRTRILSIVVAGFVLAAMGGTQAYSQQLTKVRLVHALPQLTTSFANDSSLPNYLGFWKEEGLDVEVITTPGAAAAMQLVVAKQADIGIVNAHTSMITRQRGAKVKSYYTSLRGDIYGIALPADSGMTKLSDLKGKSVGVSSFASAGAPYGKALLATAGLEAGKDVTLVEIGVGGRAAAALRANQVQAFSVWDEMYARFNQMGIKLLPTIQDQRAKDFFASNLTVNEEDFKAREAILIGVARGIAKAQLFSENNLGAAVRIHWKVYPQSAPREGVTDEAVRREVEVLSIRTKMQSKNAVGTNRYGDIPFENIRRLQEYFVASGQIEKSMEPREYYTNDLIDKINAFDHAAIVKRAKEFKLP